MVVRYQAMISEHDAAPLPAAWSVVIIRQALAADAPRAFHRRCLCAIAD
jgi:hypothetical protein